MANALVQRKLATGVSDDPLEQEADRVADRVLAAPVLGNGSADPPRIHRCGGQSGIRLAGLPGSVGRVLASVGKPLEPALQQEMGRRFGYDFSRVRVHVGSDAEQSARDMNANAYTVGADIVFGADRFSEGTQVQRLLLAHELTHVVQQMGSTGGRVALQREPADDLQSFQIEGGHYSAEEKKDAVENPAGLILTASTVGKYERKLGSRAPGTLTVGKQWMRFEGGRLGKFVSSYNDFTYYLGEVLQGIGRLRDLLSAGAPEFPTEMTARQRRALRPTDDTSSSVVKKEAYRDWREAQSEYAGEDGSGGKTFSGLAFDAARTDRDFDQARQVFWEEKGELLRSIEAGKQLDKPRYEALEITFGDLVSLVDPLAAAGVAADKILDARKKRSEYDRKMKEFGDAVKTANESVRDRFEAFKRAGTVYWAKLADRQAALRRRDQARTESRQRAALVGQATAAPSETRPAALAEVRMPELVADAWHALAVIGPPARAKLGEALADRGVVERASKTDLSWRGNNDPYEARDITQLRRAWQRALSWEGVLSEENIAEWVAVDKLWEETFTKFNV